MFTRTLTRDNEMIRISDYGFEYYNNGVLIRDGLVDGLAYTIGLLIQDGWTLIDQRQRDADSIPRPEIHYIPAHFYKV